MVDAVNSPSKTRKPKMIPYEFEYTRAASVKDAVELLSAGGESAHLLAGGHSLIPAMKFRLNPSKKLIDITEITELAEIEVADGKLHLGALATHSAVENSDVVKNNCAVLAEAAGLIGDKQVRNRGTIGGSLAHADPAADYPALVLALGAEIEVAGPAGSRTIRADDFFTGMFETALQNGEMITKVSFPVISEGTGAAYAKFPHPASRFAVAGVAAMVTVDDAGKCTDARVGVTGAAASAFRAANVESALAGTSLSEQDISNATTNVADPADLLSDLIGSGEYRAHLCSVLARQAIAEAAGRV
jgi:carbon-monoxide dehydrogenase medium subunit